MRRMKVVLVVLCVLAPLAMCHRQKARSSTNRMVDKTEKGKYKPTNYVANGTSRTTRFDELVVESEEKFAVYDRNKRAIDSNR